MDPYRYLALAWNHNNQEINQLDDRMVTQISVQIDSNQYPNPSRNPFDSSKVSLFAAGEDEHSVYKFGPGPSFLSGFRQHYFQHASSLLQNGFSSRYVLPY